VKPALTTRLGGAGILVSPKMCLTVTEPSLATSPGFVELQEANQGSAHRQAAPIVRKPAGTHTARTRRA